MISGLSVFLLTVVAYFLIIDVFIIHRFCLSFAFLCISASNIIYNPVLLSNITFGFKTFMWENWTVNINVFRLLKISISIIFVLVKIFKQNFCILSSHVDFHLCIFGPFTSSSIYAACSLSSVFLNQMLYLNYCTSLVLFTYFFQWSEEDFVIFCW